MTSEDVCPESEEGDQNEAGGLSRIWHIDDTNCWVDFSDSMFWRAVE